MSCQLALPICPPALLPVNLLQPFSYCTCQTGSIPPVISIGVGNSQCFIYRRLQAPTAQFAGKYVQCVYMRHAYMIYALQAVEQ